MYQEQQNKVSVVLVIYNAAKYVNAVFGAIFAQTYKDLEVIAVINGNEDGCRQLIEQNYPQVKIIDEGRNLWFAEGNNLGIAESSGEFIQLVNQDLILEPNYIERMLEDFSDKRVGAATGKLLRYDFEKNEKTKIIDTTGIVISKSGRARDRGQLEKDWGQYDSIRDVFAVSGAGPMYRRSALEEVKYCENYKCEYFDSDFQMYWEDVDLSWRLNRCGYKNVYVPKAVAYHGRTAGQSEGGYLHFLNFIRHHRKIAPFIRQWNYRNHFYMYLKNTRIPSLSFLFRELAMLVYIVIFEPGTLKVVPGMVRLWPKMMRKRRFILE